MNHIKKTLLTFFTIIAIAPSIAAADCSAYIQRSKSGKELISTHSLISSFRDLKTGNTKKAGLRLMNEAKDDATLRVEVSSAGNGAIGVAKAEARLTLSNGQVVTGAKTYLFEDGTWMIAIRQVTGLGKAFITVDPNQKVSCSENVDEKIATIETLISSEAFSVQDAAVQTLPSTQLIADRLFGSLAQEA